MLLIIFKSLFLYLVLLTNTSFSNSLNIYSARQEVLMRDLISSFEKKEKIKVNIISAKASQLIEKIEMEEKYTKADVLLTVDIARLLEAKNRDLFVLTPGTTKGQIKTQKMTTDQENPRNEGYRSSHAWCKCT